MYSHAFVCKCVCACAHVYGGPALIHWETIGDRSQYGGALPCSGTRQAVSLKKT